ncbi:MAG: aminoacrylate peracid reductase [Hyphomicrobiales bacterium]|jgi:aminoacrylate peracid reductase|nr:aminoacrylate peracid reductase [Hyphomicrobiales bacterium]
MRSRIVPPTVVEPFLEPYSAARVSDNVIYVSGTVALDAEGNLVGADDIRAQTEYVIELIQGILKFAGGTLQDVTFNQIFLAYLADYEAMNEVYREYFSEEPPARSCVRVDLLKPEYLVQISSVAHLKKEQSVLGAREASPSMSGTRRA